MTNLKAKKVSGMSDEEVKAELRLWYWPAPPVCTALWTDRDFLIYAMSQGKRMKFLSICQSCVYKWSESMRFSMLSTYSLTNCQCSLCGRIGDLAMVKDLTAQEVT
jgi:hypothetical protein